MDSSAIPNGQTKEELLDAQTYIWSHILNFLHSMALKCAIQLNIPDTIHKHGKPMSLVELANSLCINPNKVHSLSRLMRMLVNSNFFSSKKLVTGEEAFALTLNSKLLLKDHPLSFAPLALALLDQTLTEPSHHLCSWFKNDDESPFHTAHGTGIWEYACSVPKFNECFNQAMASDAKYVSSILLGKSEFRGLFEGVGSLVDVGGGNGTMAKAIAKAYPTMKCMVLDLPHVVNGLHDNGLNLVYVGGDMFDAVPPADAVLLKWILHDWSDEDCIKILKKCKDAIPSRDNGGKVIIIDIVVKIQNKKHTNTQLLFDMEMLSASIGGKERTEDEWKQLFTKAGYNGYKIFPVLGARSVIAVYPA